MQVVRLSDVVGVNSMIEGRTFEDALIVGPSVIAPLNNVEITNCSFDGDPDSLFIEVPENRKVIGVIGLQNVAFRRCEFRNIAVIGTPLSVARFKQGFTPTPPIVPQG